MRYSHLRAFHAVATAGGFSAAARALNQTQPSLSDQVRKLEQGHDTLLFHRAGRLVRLTEAGEGLLRLTRAFFEAEDRIGDYLDEARAAPSGTLRIVADSALHITEDVSAFRARHPNVFISITTGNSEQVLERLRSYEADVAVLGKPSAAPDLDILDLGVSPIVAIAARGLVPKSQGPRRLSDLGQWPLVFREVGSRTRAMLEAEAERQNVPLSPAIEVEGREAMREVVASGAGLGFVLQTEIGHDPRLISFPLEGSGLAMPEALVTLRNRAEVPVIRAFLASVRHIT